MKPLGLQLSCGDIYEFEEKTRRGQVCVVVHLDPGEAEELSRHLYLLRALKVEDGRCRIRVLPQKLHRGGLHESVKAGRREERYKEKKHV